MANRYDVFVIVCRTGCTCCSNENHIRGIYLTEKEAQSRIDRFRKGIDNPVASQYSKYGNYRIEKRDAEEIIENNRLIISDRIFYKSDIVSVNIEDGSLIDKENDYLTDDEYL